MKYVGMLYNVLLLRASLPSLDKYLFYHAANHTM